MRELAARLDPAEVRYGQVWEDADVLLEGLDVRAGHACLSIASAGDNALALLTRRPSRVIAIDLSPAQLACLHLRVAAYRTLSHPQLLELVGSLASDRRTALYRRCRAALAPEARRFWDARPHAIEQGIGSAGRFERYLQTFRTRVLPFAHDRQRIEQLLVPRAPGAREAFFDRHWNTPRWRVLFRLFFSRLALRLGRDREFFRFATLPAGQTLSHRVRHGLTALPPSDNPYLHWILTGTHRHVLPLALRPEHFDTIRENLDRLEWRCQSLQDFVWGEDIGAIDRFNLSDVFEYMAPEDHQRTLARIASRCPIGTRLAYWNFLVQRRAAGLSRSGVRALSSLAERLHAADRAFFYSDFVLEEVA